MLKSRVNIDKKYTKKLILYREISDLKTKCIIQKAVSYEKSFYSYIVSKVITEMSILMIIKDLGNASEMPEIVHKEQDLIFVTQKRISVVF